MKWIRRCAVACWLIFFLWPAGYGQSSPANPTLSKHALQIKQKIDALLPQASIIVVQKQAKSRNGRFVSNDSESFTFYDLAEAKNVTLRYEDVEKITNVSSNVSSTTHHHHTVLKYVIFGIVFAGGLLALSLAAAAS